MTTPLATPEQVAALRESVEALRLTEEAKQLETTLRQHEMRDRLIEAWGDPIDPLEFLAAEPGFFGGAAQGARMDRASDRAHGDNAPHWDSEQGLAGIRGVCDYLGQTDPIAVGMFNLLCGYVVKDGLTHTAEAISPEGEQWAEAVQEVIDEFLERSKWYGGKDAESYKRVRRQGERFLRRRVLGGGYVSVEFYEPSWIVEPMNARHYELHYGLPEGLCWKYGVVTDPKDVTQIYGYFACKYGDPENAEFIPAHEMSHVKANVDENVKRGVPDLYAGKKWLAAASKLLERVMSGAAIQASIALIYSYPDGTRREKVQSAADGRVTFTTTERAPGGSSRSVNAEHYPPGKIVDKTGVDVQYGPMGQSSAPTYVDVIQAGLRILVVRWNGTENMISGDASNNNRASLTEAQTPFANFVVCEQGKVAVDDVDTLWMVVGEACGTRLPIDVGTLRRLVKIKATPQDAESRDPKAEHEIRKGEFDAGVLSAETWAKEVGRDYADEVLKGAKRVDPLAGMLDPQTGLPVTPHDPWGGRRPTNAPRLEQLAEQAFSRWAGEK